MTMPFQNAPKFPATRPERTVREAPPSRDAETISATCLDLDEVKTLVSSGITAAAMVPQLMIIESFHQRPSAISPIMTLETAKVTAIDKSEVSHTRVVRGISKSKWSRFPNIDLET